MRILLTGSSGWLGSALSPRLRALGHDVTGLDPVPSRETRIVGSIADRDLVLRTVRDNRIEAIIHSGALHKPNIENRANSIFCRDQRARHVEPARRGGGVRRGALRLHVDDLVDDFTGDTRRVRGWCAQGRLADRGDVARAAQHLRRHQAFGRTSLPPLSYPARPAGGGVAHRPLLSRSRRHGACDRTVGCQHQGQ